MAAAGAGGYTIGNSVYGDGSTGYFSRTPSASTNNQTWTFSCWVKLVDFVGRDAVLFSQDTGVNYTALFFKESADTQAYCLEFRNIEGTSSIITSAVFRDVGAWYHVVCAVDTTQATAANRVRIYVNGTETAYQSASYPALNASTYWNNTFANKILAYSATYAACYIAEVRNIGGQQLTPSSFGETDSVTGSWKPKRYSGTYGTNGFYLPFTNSSNLGALDSSLNPSSEYTKVLIHSDHSDASTTFTDSAKGRTITASSVEHDTAQAKFGSSAIRFTTTTSYLSAADSADFTIGTQDFTIDFWVRWSSAVPGTGRTGFVGNGEANANDRSWGLFYQNSTQVLAMQMTSSGTADNYPESTATWAPTANTWYHVAVTRASGQLRYFIDGTQLGSAIADSTNIRDATAGLRIGATTTVSASEPASYEWMDEVRVIVGEAAWTSSFTPPTRTYGGLNFTKTGTITQTTDSPTDSAATNVGNYCTWDPLTLSSYGTLSTGNLKHVGSSATNSGNVWGTIKPSSGKYYWEVTVSGASTSYPNIGIVENPYNLGPTLGAGGQSGGNGTAGLFMYGAAYLANGTLSYGDGSQTASWGATFTANDVIQVALDMDNGAVYFGKNNTWQNSGVPTSGSSKTGAAYTWTAGTKSMQSAISSYQSGTGGTANFGQTAFTYTPPTGFKRLSTANLPAPSIKNDDLHFNVVTYTGTGASRSITGVGFQPDLVWIKRRNDIESHALFDAVRGVTKMLYSNLTNAEATDTNTLTSFDSDGFSVGTSVAVNGSTATYVAWCWKGNGAGSSNTSGSITSTVSANTTAGFSIVTYTGTGANATVGHGLGVAPGLVIVKKRSAASTNGWPVWHTSTTATQSDPSLYLNLTNALSTGGGGLWNNTAPTSTVFSIGTDGETNTSSATYVAYCFAEVTGFSKFGSWTAAQGTFVYCGFQPKFLLCKSSTTAATDWQIIDDARSPYNAMKDRIAPNSSAAEGVGAYSNGFDFISNGFVVREATGGSANSGTMIFAAFAEYPFGGTGTTQGKAR